MQLKEKEIENIKNKWEIWEILRQLFGDERIFFFFFVPREIEIFRDQLQNLFSNPIFLGILNFGELLNTRI